MKKGPPTVKVLAGYSGDRGFDTLAIIVCLSVSYKARFFKVTLEYPFQITLIKLIT